MLSTLCLAAVVYFEARSEPLDAQANVAGVVLERVASGKYPDEVCQVAFEHKQFTAFNNGPEPISDTRAWDIALMVARMVMQDREGVVSIQGATHYHADWSYPYWSSELDYLGTSGGHLFYVER